MHAAIRVTMSKNPKDISRKDASVTSLGLTAPGALYSTYGPIPVAEVEESNSDSVWAMFEDVSTKAAPLAPSADSPGARDESSGPEDMDPYAPTEMSPLR